MANKALQQFDKQLNKIYAPQEAFLQKQYEATLPQFAAQRSSLEQAKINAFRDIGDQANRQGMFFSGFQPTEQARFVGEKYLPALAQVAQGEQQAKLGLLEAITGLRTQRAEQRLGFRETLRQEAVQRAREKREFQRQLQMQDRSFQQQRSLAASSGRGADEPSFDDILAEMSNTLDGSRNKYGRVPLSVYKAGRAKWKQAGLNVSVYDKQFKNKLAKHLRKKIY